MESPSASEITMPAGAMDMPMGSEQTSVIVALCLTNHKLGVACYDEISNSILADTFHFPEGDYEDILIQLKVNADPTLFVLHPTIITNKELLALILQGTDGSPECYRYKTLKTSMWNEKTNMALIHNCLSIRKAGRELNSSQVYMALAACTDANSTVLIQSLGALISFMQDTVFHLDSGKVVIADIKEFPSSKLLRIDSNSFNALQIFTEDIHPNWIKGKGRSKEGFSLFSLLDRTQSLPGRYKLRDWMARPLCDIEAIAARQKGVAFAAAPSNADFVRQVSGQLKRVHDLPRLILRIKKVEANYLDWCRLYSSLSATIEILCILSDYLSSPPSSPPEHEAFIAELAAGLEIGALNDLKANLQEWIDFEQSMKDKDIVVRQGCDDLLDEKRELYQDLEGYLVQAAQQILTATPCIPSLSVEYVPQVGYLAVIADEHVRTLRERRWIQESESSRLDSAPPNSFSEVSSSQAMLSAPAIPAEDQFTFVFSQNHRNFFKHRIVYDLDNTIGDVQSDIQDRQRMIVLQLEESLLDLEGIIHTAAGAMSTLDAFLSLGAIAQEYRMVAPQIVDEPVLVIKGGRHLLQEQTVDNFVPNDTLLTEQKNIALISGPNSSGKSVYLKQVGIIVYLAHLGAFVPADHAVIGLTDKILTRIASLESVSTPQSAFMMDLTQMAKMLRSRTIRSLCLIDEFGKGTNPADGMALLASIIEDFTISKSRALFVLHFTEILCDQVLSAQTMNSIHCFRMQTLVEDEDDPDQPTVPLYKLRFGVGENSEGIACAQKMGVPARAIDRALQIKECLTSHTPLQPLPRTTYKIFENPNHRELLKLFLQEDWATADEALLDKLRSLL